MPKAELIHGDRRADRRYSFEMPVRFTYQVSGRPCSGTGTTLDLSSGGIRFLTDTPPPQGVEVDLRVAWPFLLQNVCPMDLVVHGKIVRGGPEEGVVLMEKHEFRTRGTRSFDTEDAASRKCDILA